MSNTDNTLGFIEKLDRFRSRYGDQNQFAFDDYPEYDDGKGL